MSGEDSNGILNRFRHSMKCLFRGGRGHNNQATPLSDYDHQSWYHGCKENRLKPRVYQRNHVPNFLPERWSSAGNVGDISISSSHIVPSPRSGHVAVIRDEYMYVYGGFTSSGYGQAFRELWRYHLLSEQWDLVKPSGISPATPCSQSGLIIDKSHMLVFGGTSYPFGAMNGNTLHLYNFKTEEWSFLAIDPEIQAPSARFGQTALLTKDGKLWLIGGTNGFLFYMDVWVYDLKEHMQALKNENQGFEGKWTELTIDGIDRPRGRYKHETVLDGDTIIMIGGGWPFPTGETVIDHVYLLDTFSLEWKRQACTAADQNIGLPESRRSHTCTKIGQYVYMIGGTGREPIASESVWRLNLRSWVWVKVDATWPKPSFFHSCALSPEGYIFSFAGVESCSESGHKERHAEVHQFTPRLPELHSLTERCLQLLSSRCECTTQAMRSWGLPMKLIKRAVAAPA